MMSVLAPTLGVVCVRRRTVGQSLIGDAPCETQGDRETRLRCSDNREAADPSTTVNSGLSLVESGAGAVVDRPGAVHASRCRAAVPRPCLRFQSPLIKPGVPFSSTRLSEVFHRVAVGVAVYHLTVPS